MFYRQLSLVAAVAGTVLAPRSIHRGTEQAKPSEQL